MRDEKHRAPHEGYTTTPRHWCPRSEKHYTGADSLLTALRQGWEIFGMVYREDVLLGGARMTTVYHFDLLRGQDILCMPVVANPFVQHLINERRLLVVPYRYWKDRTTAASINAQPVPVGAVSEAEDDAETQVPLLDSAAS